MTSRFVMSLTALLVLAGAGCQGREPSRTGSSQEEDGPPVVSVTRWTGRSELFMEHPVLIAGRAGRFAIHVTNLSDFKPLSSGEVIVRLQSEDSSDVEEFRGGPSRPGIFGLDVSIARPGAHRMSIAIESPQLKDSYEVGQVTVHPPGTRPDSREGADDESITFLKEQQWTLDFGTEPVEVRILRSDLTVPAEVRPRSGGEAMIAAPVPGRLDPAVQPPTPGARVSKGTIVARVIPRSEDLRDASALKAELVDAEQRYELAKQDRERAARLVEARAAPQRRLAESDAGLATSWARLEAARQRMARLETLSTGGGRVSGVDAFTVRAPFDGVVFDVNFAPGASVQEGESLARLIDIDQVHIAGWVPEASAASLRELAGAELLVEESKPIPLGRALSVGQVVDPVSRTVEVRYLLDNRSERLRVGQTARLRLLFGEGESLPAVPESAVIDDGGRPVVFVQKEGESFERRAVRLGSRTGGYTHVLEGVTAGERVVSRGAYLIRLAAMSSQIPAHGHVH